MCCLLYHRPAMGSPAVASNPSRFTHTHASIQRTVLLSKMEEQDGARSSSSSCAGAPAEPAPLLLGLPEGVLALIVSWLAEAEKHALMGSSRALGEVVMRSARGVGLHFRPAFEEDAAEDEQQEPLSPPHHHEDVPAARHAGPESGAAGRAHLLLRWASSACPHLHVAITGEPFSRTAKELMQAVLLPPSAHAGGGLFGGADTVHGHALRQSGRDEAPALPGLRSLTLSVSR